MPEQTPSQQPAPGPESLRVVGLRPVFDDLPEAGVTWLPLSFGLMDLARALRAAGFDEPFVEKAILEYIRANPLDQGPHGSVHYVLSDEDNEAVRQAGASPKDGHDGDA